MVLLKRFKNFAGKSKEILGIFCHGLILTVLTSPFAISILVCVSPKIDPTYLLFRNVSWISPNWRMFFRILIYFFSMLHVCILDFGFGIVMVNMLESITMTLKSIQAKNSFPEILKITTYREIELVNLAFNQVLHYSLPVILLMALLCTVLMGYIVIKMTGQVPPIFTLMVLSIVISILGFIQLVLPIMADVVTYSSDFLRCFNSRKISRSLKKELASCRPLKIWMGQYRSINRYSRTKFFELGLYYTTSFVISGV